MPVFLFYLLIAEVIFVFRSLMSAMSWGVGWRSWRRSSSFDILTNFRAEGGCDSGGSLGNELELASTMADVRVVVAWLRDE